MIYEESQYGDLERLYDQAKALSNADAEQFLVVMLYFLQQKGYRLAFDAEVLDRDGRKVGKVEIDDVLPTAYFPELAAK
jgi:hypothetical protein